MVFLHQSRQFLFLKRYIDLFKYYSSVSMLSFFTVALAYITLFFSSEWTFSFLLLAAISLFLVYSKFLNQNSSNKPPSLSNFQTIRLIYLLVRSRTTAGIKFVQIVLGMCLWFAKEGMYSFTVATETFLLIYDPKSVESILSSHTILQKGFLYEFAKQLLKEGLITSSGSAWHYRRKLLTPAFHYKILREFIPVFNKQAKVFVKRIEDFMEKQESINIVPLVRLCTLDVILETAMGKSVNAQEGKHNEYVKAANTWTECLSKRIILPHLWPDFIYRMSQTGKTNATCLDVMENFTREVINDRLRDRMAKLKNTERDGFTSSSNDIGRKSKQQLALLDLLLDLHIQDKDKLSLKDIADEVNTFVFAGHDTTASTLSFALYMLGLHKDIQMSAQDEVDMVLGDDVDRMITNEDIRKFKYLLCVLKETMRLFPAVPGIARIANEDTIVGGYEISKGTTVIIPIYMVHRDPKTFQNPEEFNPGRFSTKNWSNRQPFAYVPFSAGPRNCIGQRFATNEIITVLATVLRHFHITSMEPRDKITIDANFILRTVNGLHLKFSKRQFLRSYSNLE